jgi:hypothetical protein
MKLKESAETKEYLAIKIKSLDENIKLFENNDLTKFDITQGGTDIVEENVRRSKIKEIKQAKELLEMKLINIDEHIQNLIEENEISKTKKFDLKLYLDNFEKDKREAEKQTQRFQRDQEGIKKKLEEQAYQDERKRKEREEHNEKEKEEKEAKKHEDYLKKLEVMKLKTKDKHEEVEKLKEDWKSKITIEKNYKYLSAEEDFKHKQERVEEDRKNKYLTEIMKKRTTLLKPLKKDELDEFSKKVMEERQKKLYDKEKERLLKQEEIMNVNLGLPKSDTHVYKQIVDEEKKFKNMKEKDKLDKLYNILKVKNYSKDVKETLLPDIDENKKKEREERIENLANPKVQKLKRKRGRRVLLVKPKNRINNTSHSHKSLNVSKHSIVRSSHSLDESEKYEYNEIKKKLYKSGSQGKRKPREKVPDYLTELRMQKEKVEKEIPQNSIFY